MRPYEIIEHTADIGIRTHGRTLRELFIHMAQGLFSLIVPPKEVQKRDALIVEVRAEDREKLFVAWLKELIYLFDTRHFLARGFEIELLTQNALKAKVYGEPLDPSRHHVDKEVKAVTYCDFSMSRGKDGLWRAQVIFDI